MYRCGHISRTCILPGYEGVILKIQETVLMSSWGCALQYAIRPSVRGNNKFHRDIIIKTVADVVGKEHPVNLKNYDQMILVDVCQVSSTVMTH